MKAAPFSGLDTHLQWRHIMDDGDYTGIDELMYWVTTVILVLMTIVFLAGVAGFVWALI